MKVLNIAALAVASMIVASNWASADPPDRRDSRSSERNDGDHGSKGHLSARLYGSGTAQVGKAEYESEISRGVTRTKLEVELNGLTLPAGTQLKICVNGVEIGTGRVTVSRGRGKFKLKLSSAPSVAKGSQILVKTTGGTTVAVGTF